ncbi:MAG: right-handed parallel beta-helix repeat-containing protein [Sedimentisphaerales bacterium]|nr:right-handed parallel beta-helix repeat-containing protein [Sedimentisphaerales bacterium]
MRIISLKYPAAALAAAVLLLAGAPAYCLTYYADAAGGNDAWNGTAATHTGGIDGPKATLQAAIDQSTAGDTIIAADGLYAGSGNRDLDFAGRAILLQSAAGADNCIIDCQGTSLEPHRAFYFHQGETADSVVDGFTIRHGFAWGAGVYCLNSSPTIRNCVFRDNVSEGKGGAIACDLADLILEDCILQGNTATDGGGIYVFSSQLQIDHCQLRENWATSSYPFGRGGGLCLESESVVTISNSAIYGNLSASWGGAIFCQDASLELTNCLINGNRAESHGGGLYADRSAVTIRNCTWNGNTAQWFGGAVRAYNDTLMEVVNSIFWNNFLGHVDGKGAQFAAAADTDIQISHCDLQGGLAGVYREFGSTLSWSVTNIDQDPEFAAEGYWDPNQTSEQTDDDFWVEGDYRLLSHSPCINRGSNSAIADVPWDLNGYDRITEAIVDLGPYENGLRVEQLTVKADKDRSRRQDAFKLTGVFFADEQDIASMECQIHLGPWSDTLTFNSTNFKQAGSSPKYSYKGVAGSVQSMKLDLVKHTFQISGKGIDLSGLLSPLPVAIATGDYSGACMVGEQAINGSKYCPLSLLMGQADALRVEKHAFKAGKSPGSDALALQGSLAFQDILLDPTESDVTIRWGNWQFSIPAGSDLFTQKGTKRSFLYKSSTLMARFDLEKGVFKIQIKNADIGIQPYPVDFHLTIGAYNQTCQVN